MGSLCPADVTQRCILYLTDAGPDDLFKAKLYLELGFQFQEKQKKMVHTMLMCLESHHSRIYGLSKTL